MTPCRKRHKLRPEVVEATRKLIACKPWRGNPGRGSPAEQAAARAAFHEWLRTASGAYKMDPPALVISPAILFVYYFPCLNIIGLSKYSVFSLLYGFRCAWQAQKGKVPARPEEDARSWTAGLVRAADRAFYENAVRKGLVLFS